MIIRIPPRQTGSFRKLANYILDKTHHGAKVAEAWSMNCNAGYDFDLAISEVIGTQQYNTRAPTNLTMHVVVSFEETNLPSPQLREIEQKICDALGMGGHQRLCAVHNDTSHLHFHIALSRVNPETHRAINPSYSRYRLQEVGRTLEREYGLVPTITDGSGAHLDDEAVHGWEVHAGLGSFQRWMKERHREALCAADSWKSLHAIGADNGFTLERRGAGLVFVTANRVYAVKASSVARELSLSQLTARLGEYRAASRPREHEGYEKRPLHHDNFLWQRYLDKVEQPKRAYHIAVKDLRGERDERRAAILQEHRTERIKVQRGTLKKSQKKAKYSLLRYQRTQQLDELHAWFLTEQTRIRVTYTYLSWTEFLQQEALAGHIRARTLLQRTNKNNYHDPAVSSTRRLKEDPPIPAPVELLDIHVNRYGDVEYKLKGGYKITDTGRRIYIDSRLSPEAVSFGVRLALNTFGRDIKITDERLLSEVVKLAQGQRMSITINGTTPRARSPGGKEWD